MSKLKLWRPLLFVIALNHTDSLLAASCEYTILNEWNTGFTAEVVITNDTQETIDGWSVTWSYTDGSIVPQAWDANLEGTNPYTATSYSYNANIAPNASTTFGFNGNKNSSGLPAEIPSLSGTCSSSATNLPPVAVAVVTPSQGNIPFDVVFDASASSDLDNDTLSYRWDFGNGQTSTEAIVTQTFTQVGNYSVSLIVNDGELDSNEVLTTVVATDDILSPQAYVLDANQSSLYFVSTKQTHTLETHYFATLSGGITESGEAKLSINLNSVDTGITIRNERLRNLLFETATYSEATVSLPVNVDGLDNISSGETQTQLISASLDLHGITTVVDTEVMITKLSDNQLIVQNISPILINAQSHDLTAGIDALRSIANLDSISYTVPVNFTLFFTRP